MVPLVEHKGGGETSLHHPARSVLHHKPMQATKPLETSDSPPPQNMDTPV